MYQLHKRSYNIGKKRETAICCWVENISAQKGRWTRKYIELIFECISYTWPNTRSKSAQHSKLVPKRIITIIFRFYFLSLFFPFHFDAFLRFSYLNMKYLVRLSLYFFFFEKIFHCCCIYFSRRRCSFRCSIFFKSCFHFNGSRNNWHPILQLYFIRLECRLCDLLMAIINCFTHEYDSVTQLSFMLAHEHREWEEERDREKRAWASIGIVFQNARGKCEKSVWHVAISHNSTAKLWALQNNLYQRANQIMVFFRLQNLSLPFDSISFSLPF